MKSNYKASLSLKNRRDQSIIRDIIFRLWQGHQRIKVQGITYNYCSRQVDPVARIIKEGKLFRPPHVVRPSNLTAFSEENDPFGD
jgi:hypothetical protein